jgi:hypothetical protein
VYHRIFTSTLCVAIASKQQLLRVFRVDHLLGILPDSSLCHIFAPLSLCAHQALNLSICFCTSSRMDVSLFYLRFLVRFAIIPLFLSSRFATRFGSVTCTIVQNDNPMFPTTFATSQRTPIKTQDSGNNRVLFLVILVTRSEEQTTLKICKRTSCRSGHRKSLKYLKFKRFLKLLYQNLTLLLTSHTVSSPIYVLANLSNIFCSRLLPYPLKHAQLLSANFRQKHIFHSSSKFHFDSSVRVIRLFSLV